MMRETNPIEQKLRITLENAIAGADIQQHLKQVEKALNKAQKSISKYDKLFARHTKTIKAAKQPTALLVKQQLRLGKSITSTLSPMKRQLNLLRKTKREMTATNKISNSLGNSMSRIAGVVGAAGLGYAAISRIRKIMDSRLNLAVTGGADQIQLIKQLTQGRNTTAAIDLAGRFQQQSPYSRFALGGDSLQGLVTMQKQLESVGLQTANDLILAVTRSLEPAKLQRMLKTASSGNVKGALLSAASGSNIGAVTSALNALQIGNLAGESKLDPMLQAATEFKQTGNRLAESFDKLADNLIKDLMPAIQALTNTIEKLAGVAGGLSGKQLLGYGLGGYLGYKGLKGIGGYALRRILTPGVPGVAPGGFGGMPGVRIPGMRPALPGRFVPPGGLGPSGYPVISPLHLPAGGIVGTGLAGGAAAASSYTAYKSAQTAYSERQALKAIQKTQENDNLFKIARRLKSSATSPLEQLKAKRMQLDAMISSNAPAGDLGIKKDWIGRTLGFYGDFPQTDTKQMDRLRKQRQELHKQIKLLEKQEQADSGGMISDIFDSVKTGIDKVTKSADKLKSGFDNLVSKGMENHLHHLQQQAAKAEQLVLSATEESARTAISRLDFDIATTTPFGKIGALSEYRNLQKQLGNEIEALTQVMQNIDKSTQAGKIEAMRMNQQIKSLRLEERTRGLEMTQAMLSSVKSEAFQAGRFEKIIINQDLNVRAGLHRGILNPQIPEHLGATGKTAVQSRRKPIRLSPANNAAEALAVLGKAAQQAAPYIHDLIADEDEYAMRPAAEGFRAIQ